MSRVVGDVEIPMSLTSFELTSGCHWRVALSRSYWPFVVASTSNDELPISAGRLTLPGCVESSHFPSDAAIYGESAVPPPSLIAPAVPSTTVGDAAAAEARRTVSVDGSLWNLVEDRGTRVYEATATHPVLSGDRTSSHWSSWSCTEEAARKNDGSDSHTATYKSSHARLGGRWHTSGVHDHGADKHAGFAAQCFQADNSCEVHWHRGTRSVRKAVFGGIEQEALRFRQKK